MTNHIQLTAPEAQTLTDRAIQLADDLARTLVAIHDGNGHRALGYKSFRAYCAAHFEPSLSTIYRMMRRERARDALAECLNLTRFTNGALEALAGIDDDHIRTVAEIAAQAETGDIGVQAVKAVQAAITETLITGAVVDAVGNQYRIDDVMADGVKGMLRENFLCDGKREYLAANVPVYISDFRKSTAADHIRWVTFHVDAKYLAHVEGPVFISIWREQS
jgi:hypothetical protein